MIRNKYLSGWVNKLFVLILLAIPVLSMGQTPADSLYELARITAFEQKNNQLAIGLTREAIKLEPQTAHFQVFLGRLYAWEGEYTFAEAELNSVLHSNPAHLDARLALLDVYLWSAKFEELEQACSEGLQHHPDDPNILYKNGQALAAMNDTVGALRTFNLLKKIDPQYSNLDSQIQALKAKAAPRKIKIMLGYDRLAETRTAWQFLVSETSMDPWSSLAMEYEHPFDFGQLIFRLNAASRFSIQGTMFEIESYPKIRKGTYTYLALATSGSSIYPKTKAGLEVFQELPRAYEGSVGLRYLKVPDERITVFTASVGKYLGNNWINARTFITPQSASLSKSWSLVLRHYLADADEYWELNGGGGEVPDENLGAEEISYLGARRLGLMLQKKLRQRSLIQVRLNFLNQEVRTQSYRGTTGFNITLEQRL
ncbi:MAG: YaiO family outer membrane beta-barrel protein [Candidatus Marinimicrobia bacterium]|nr:YaiO family outer membrane beta-barrel protein [Candidatus Neomarinimicrobiota bacterium]